MIPRSGSPVAPPSNTPAEHPVPLRPTILMIALIGIPFLLFCVLRSVDAAEMRDDPATALRTQTWQVESIDHGRRLGAASLQFSESELRLWGPCGSAQVPYELRDTVINIGRIQLAKDSCPQSAMSEMLKLVRLLEGAETYHITDDGTLRLNIASGRYITARP